MSRNVRNEIKKGKKIYFYDNGIRNAIIRDFTPLPLRNDIGALWENYLTSERLKFLANNNTKVERYFWRTSQQQEIDYVEESEGKLKAFEMKWSPQRKSFISRTFTNAYPDAAVKVITPEIYEQFLSEY